MAQQPLVGHGLLIIEASRSHSDTLHSVGLVWTRDRPDTETPTWQHTALRWGRHPCPREDSNPQSSKWAAANPCLRECGYSDLTLYWGGIYFLLESLCNRDVGSRRCWWCNNEWSGKMAVTYLKVRPSVCETSRLNEMIWSSSKRARNNRCSGRNSNRVFQVQVRCVRSELRLFACRLMHLRRGQNSLVKTNFWETEGIRRHLVSDAKHLKTRCSRVTSQSIYVPYLGSENIWSLHVVARGYFIACRAVWLEL
jgi:hypothetical protein